MARLTNTTFGPITLPTRHVIPARGELTVTDATIRDNWPSLSGRVVIGEIGVAWDDETAAPGKVARPAAMQPGVALQTDPGTPLADMPAQDRAPAPAEVRKPARAARTADT